MISTFRKLPSLLLIFPFLLSADPVLDNEFLRSVQEGDPKKIQILLQAGASVDARDSRGKTALMIADHRPEVVEVLIRAGADVNAQDRDGSSVLSESLSGLLDVKVLDIDDLAVPKRLIESGAKIEYSSKIDSSGKTAPVSALNAAIRHGNLVLVQFLIENQADVNFDKGTPEEFPLFLACGAGSAPQNFSIVEFLLKHNAKPDYTSRLHEVHSEGKTIQLGADNALHFLSEESETDFRIVDLLIKSGTNVNHRNAEGISPLLQSILKKRVGLAQKLLELGADPSLADIHGRTSLEEVRKQKLEALETLILKRLGVKENPDRISQ
ncbi:ankyrin repeat domain-containing protein [Leptospira sp. 201903070]|jgi:ankyrin repeat protein|uniref:Ankyrin repeat domain-containing protein n=1 Tax=Leptospira ainlahdjerensis TaxID=2810033 RepID=A0ABS2U8Y8_9LEPT|nr:ankyrin repeat domain-containing protein [Leptospira ainlahdjerensis]MBM9576244.1 ankyrin repeat domain-containing protein [Leptospira ainlahdjerensis]